MASDPLLELEHQLTIAALLQIADLEPSRRSRRRRSSRLALVAAALVIGLAAAAFAAVKLLQTGSPVPYRLGRPATAHTRFGTPISRTMHLSPPVADPRGGLPWAIRTFRTTRRYGCVEVGRFYEGKIGALGQDFAFGNDGRFHELRANAVDGHGTCIALDARGNPYLALRQNGLPASGDVPGSCTLAPFLVGAHSHPCPRGDLRDLEFGLAGPDATAISYRADNGALRTVRTGRGGAYLIVLGLQPPEALRTGGGRVVTPDYFSITATPASSTLVEVHYRDGSTCRVHPTHSFAGGCPNHGPTPIAGRLPTRAAVRTPLHLTVTGSGRAAVLHVRFRARVPVINGNGVYDLIVKPVNLAPPGSHSIRCRRFISQPIDRDVATGQNLRQDIALRGFDCSGPYTVSLSYRVESGTPGPFGPSSKYPGRHVASARVPVPGG
jgi:hypothetical protein